MNNFIALAAYILILSTVGMFSFSSVSISDERTIDDQANEISNQLLCPVCAGQSVAESNSNLANDMRQVIRKKLEEGQTQEEIMAYFIDTYGDTILGAPPAKGVNLFLWLLPGAAIVAGLFGIGIFLYRAGSESEEEPEFKQKTEGGSSDPYLNRIDEEINKDS